MCDVYMYVHVNKVWIDFDDNYTSLTSDMRYRQYIYTYKTL